MGEGAGAFERVGYVGVDLVGGGDRARGVDAVVPDLDNDDLRGVCQDNCTTSASKASRVVPGMTR